MNSLWEALLAKQDHASLSRGLAEMTRLLEGHFATEEAHMAAHPYAGSAAHRVDHERALETARSLAAHVDEQSLALGIRFLYDWLLSHIRSYDAELPCGAVGQFVSPLQVSSRAIQPVRRTARHPNGMKTPSE
jgi:hemerythrin-like metal-binding protein